MKQPPHGAIILGVLGASLTTLHAQPASAPPPVQATADHAPAATPAASDLLARPAGAAAAESGDGNAKVSTGDGITLLSVPDIPALTALDATSNKLDRPDSAAGLGAALSNIVTADGSIKSGAAVEISPRLFGVDKKWTYFEYRDALWRRIVAQSALSIGTTRDAGMPSMGMATSTKGAIAARIVLINNADPLLSQGYARAVRWVKDVCKDVRPGPARLECEVTKRPEYNPEALAKEDCKDVTSADAKSVCEAKKRIEYTEVKVPWNASGLFVATAATWDFPGGKLKNVARDTWSTWVAGAVPLSDNGQLAGGLVWDHGWFTDDRLAIAGRLRLGSDGFRFTGDSTWFAKRPDGTATGRWAVGTEIRLSSTGWLTLSAGADIGGAMTQAVSILSSVKYGFSPKASWDPN
jgi:hypothetical protein